MAKVNYNIECINLNEDPKKKVWVLSIEGKPVAVYDYYVPRLKGAYFASNGAVACRQKLCELYPEMEEELYV